MQFDETHYYDNKGLDSQHFANNEQYEENNELFADLTDIMNTSKSTPKFSIIFHKSFGTYLYFKKSCSLSFLSDISD